MTGLERVPTLGAWEQVAYVCFLWDGFPLRPLGKCRALLFLV